MSDAPLKFLHPATSLIQSKLDFFSALTTDELVRSLRPGLEHSLKVRPDGTILDGHHRIAVLWDRGANVDASPREIITKE
jgi:ParB-like chromosome segregation protein Spo0J